MDEIENIAVTNPDYPPSPERIVYLIQVASLLAILVILIIGMKNGFRLDTDIINMISFAFHAVYCLLVGFYVIASIALYLLSERVLIYLAAFVVFLGLI